MGLSIWKIKYEKVMDILDYEIHPIEDCCRQVDIRELKLLIDDSGEVEETLRGAARPEVFDAIKKLADNGDTFAIF